MRCLSSYRRLVVCSILLCLSITVSAQISYSLGDLNPDRRTSQQVVPLYGGSASLPAYQIFTINDYWNGLELWRTDGTANGTEMFADLRPGHFSGSPGNLVTHGGYVYFSYRTFLYRTDGTPNGTEVYLEHSDWITDLKATSTHVYLKSLNSLYVVNGPNDVVLLSENARDDWPAGNKLYFLTTSYQLASTDGTVNGTQVLSEHAPWGYPIVFNDQLIYQDDETNELWISDGTVDGTASLVDLDPDSTASPSNFSTFGSQVFFTAYTSDLGFELYKTDGTASGTVLVKPGTQDYFYSSPITTDNRLFFIGTDPTHGRELWVSDGEDAGTQLLIDLTAGSSSSHIFYLNTLGNSLYFVHDDGTTHTLYVTDGTTTTQLSQFEEDLRDPSTGKKELLYSHANFTWNGHLYFPVAKDGELLSLWRTDGTPAGTEHFKDIAQVQTSSRNSNSIAAENGKSHVLFTTYGGDEFLGWSTDGSASGTQKVEDNYIWQAHYGEETTIFSNPSGLWETDGTTAGTRQLVNAYQNRHSARGFHEYNGELRVAIRTNIYRLDAEAGVLTHIADLSEQGAYGPVTSAGFRVTSEGTWCFTYGDDYSYEPHLQLWFGDANGFSLMGEWASETDVAFMAVVGNQLLFPADDGVVGAELWQATKAGASLLKDIRDLEDYGSSPREAIVFEDAIYFHAFHEDYGLELWRSDGTEAGTTLVKDINPAAGHGLNSNILKPFQVLGDQFYFFANDGTHGFELWRSDGTESGTAMVIDAIPGSGDLEPNELMVHHDRLYFAGSTVNEGRELWHSDGTEAGTTLAFDTIPGFVSGSPIELLSIDTGLVYWRNSPSGFEPYVYRSEPWSGFSTDQAFCANGTGFAATAFEDHPGTTYNWTVTGGSISSGQGTKTLTFESGAGVEMTVTLEVTVDGQTTQSSQTLPIAANAPDAPGPIGGVTEVCPQEAGVVFSISAVTGATRYQWTVPSGARIVSGQGTTDISVDFGTAAGEVSVVAQNICGDSTATTLDVVFTDAPDAYAGAPQTVCGLTTTLEGNSGTGTTGTWEILDGEGGSFSDIHDPSATFTGLAGHGYRIQWTLEHPTCGTTNHTTYIAFASADDMADAGPDQEVCGYYAVMAANQSNSGFGTWEVISGAGGHFEDIYDPQSLFYGLEGETYELRWRLRSKPCAETTDSMLATFHAGPPVLAGPDGTVAAGVPYLLTAQGTPGIWTIESGPSVDASQLNDPSLEGASFTASGGPGTYILRRTAHFAGCTPLWDDVSIEVTPARPFAWTLEDVGDPIVDSFTVKEPVVLGDWVYFGYHNDLWRANNTTREMVASLVPDNLRMNQFRLIPMDDQLFILIEVEYEEGQLWVTRGTPGTTFKLADKTEQYFAVGNGKLYFQTFEELWETDGSPAGTLKVSNTLAFSPIWTWNNGLFLRSNRQLYFGDGTANGTVLLHEFSEDDEPEDFFVFGDAVYFFQSGGFYRTDGTAAGTTLVKDFNGSVRTRYNNDSLPIVMGDYFYFTTYETATGRELWQSDGTEIGTTLVADLNEGTGSGANYDLVAHNGLLLFAGSNGTDSGLWTYDIASETMTYLTGPISEPFTVMGDYVYFNADDPDTGFELWRSDGTQAGTGLVADLNPGPDDGGAGILGTLNNKLLFTSNAAPEDEQLWHTDGTVVGTEPLFTFRTDTVTDRLSGIVHQDRLFYAFNDGVHGIELWLADSDGTRMVKDLRPGPFSSNPSNFVSMGDHVYFVAYEENDTVVWRSDGTEAGTFPLTVENSNTFDGVQYLTVWGDMLAFSWDGEFGKELYLSDGTSEGTRLLIDLSPNGDSSPNTLIPWGDYLLFKAIGPNGNAWFYTDGTADGTLEFNVDTGFSKLAVVGDQLYILDRSDLYVYDHPSDTPDGMDTGYMDQMIALGDRLLGIIHNDDILTLKSYDGTPTGTQTLGTMPSDPFYRFSVSDEQFVLFATMGLATTAIATNGHTSETHIFRNPDERFLGAFAFGERSLFLRHTANTGTELVEVHGSSLTQLPELIAGPQDLTVVNAFRGNNVMYLIVSGAGTSYRVIALSRDEVPLADLNFKAHLRNTADINGDGLFDSMEAQMTTNLSLQNANIHSLQGVGVFQNLRSLDLRYNPLTDASPLLDTALGTEAGDFIDLRNNRLDSDDCMVLDTLQTRADLAGSTLHYDLQGDMTYRPIPPQWPSFDITDMLGGVSEPPTTLNCGSRKRELANGTGGVR